MSDNLAQVKEDVMRLDKEGFSPFGISAELEIDMRLVYQILKGKV